MVELLLANGNTDVNRATIKSATSLFIAAQNGHDKVVKMLLAKEGIDTNKAMIDCHTPLFVAAQNGHVRVVELLLADEGVDVNKANAFGATPLYVAAKKGHGILVNMLLKHKDIQLTKAKKNGFTPLGVAIHRGHGRVAEIIKEDIKKPLNDELTCIVCLDREADVALVPCGHKNLCGPCAYQCNEGQGTCPTDRIKIKVILPLDADEGPPKKKSRL